MDASGLAVSAPTAAGRSLLEVELSAGYGKRRVLESVSLHLRRGEVLGLVGSSGAGKSTLVHSLLGLIGWYGGYAQGRIELDGRDLLALAPAELRKLRGRTVALVPQSPLAALNPSLRLLQHFREVWRAHRTGSQPLPLDRLRSLLADVQLPADDEFLARRPSQISVGQAQRLLIATALLHRPSLLIADEPTSALDPITQAEILRLLARLAAEASTAMLYISHDLLSVVQLSHRIAILHQGCVVECAETGELLDHPQHPHTRALFAALPVTPQALLERRVADTVASLESSMAGAD